MKIDEILFALATMRHRLNTSGVNRLYQHTVDRTAMIDCMRQFALEDNPAGFTDYCQNHLKTGNGDTMVDLLEELYDELGLEGGKTMWDEFALAFL